MKICYKTQHGYGEWIKFDRKDAGELTLAFQNRSDGVVSLGGRLFTLRNGEATISVASLRDGEYRPTLETDGGVYVLEGFIKSRREIFSIQTDEATVRRLINRCYTAEEEIASLKGRIAKLEALCLAPDIFNYERKEK